MEVSNIIVFIIDSLLRLLIFIVEYAIDGSIKYALILSGLLIISIADDGKLFYFYNIKIIK